MTPDEITALEQRAWTVGRTFDANPPDGTPCDYYVLKRGTKQVTLAVGSPTFANDLQALLSPLPAPLPPVQNRVAVAVALQALQAQPTISGADLAAVIQALTAT